jgi:hypothetical protein
MPAGATSAVVSAAGGTALPATVLSTIGPAGAATIASAAGGAPPGVVLHCSVFTVCEQCVVCSGIQ